MGCFAFATLSGAATGCLGAGIGIGLSGAGVGGFWGGFIPGIVTGATNGLMKGMAMRWATGNPKDFWRSFGISVGMGGMVGGLWGGIDAALDGRSFWHGGYTLEQKLEIMVAHERKGMLAAIGEGDATYYVGTRKNVRDFGGGNYSYEWGNIYNKIDDLEVNAFAIEGNEIGRNSDGLRRYGNNKIVISKIAIREMWLGGLHETLYHEWWHCNSFFTGEADFYRINHPSNYKLHLEYQAHKAINNLFPDFLHAREMMNYYYLLIK